jgi:internalin A
LQESKLDLNDIVGKAKVFFYALRHKQTEKVLAILAAAFFAAGPFLRQELTNYPQVAYLAYGFGGAFALWLVFRVWKLATPPPEPPAGPTPSAIKGLFPFTIDDGKLFAQLGRHMELQQLLGLARNDRCAMIAVRGESGAGKTSLLQAGLAFTLGAEQCIYWEAVPDKATEALLYAIRSQFPGIESLESLPEACPRRCVLVLDQFEQLRPNEPVHAQIFGLLDRIAKAPAPHRLSAIVGFRRDYMQDWADLEHDYGFHAEQVPIRLLAPATAGDALVTLAGEAGFTLDQALVNNFISGVTTDMGVSPVDIAIGVLSLANFVQQRGTAHVGLKEYSLAGGAEGLLLSFVQQKLEEIPESLRAPLLKGIVLALVSASSNQRIAAGETSAVIAARAEMAESALVPLLARLAHPRVRLLEKVAGDRYRLPHERLVPVLRRLAGGTLASMDQLRLLFEGEYARWRDDGSNRHLLNGKDLKNILRHKSQFVEGETAAGKTAYLAACQWRRMKVRLVVSLAVVVATAAGYAGYRSWDSSLQAQKLVSWGLPPGLFVMQNKVDELDIRQHPVNDFSWLRSARLKELAIAFNGSHLAGLEQLKGLTSLTLDLAYSHVGNLEGLKQLKGFTSLTLDLRNSPVTSLAGLEQIKGLTALTLDLDYSRVRSLAALEEIKGFTSLTLNLNSGFTSLAGLEQLKGLTSLTLDLEDSSVRSLAGLEQLKGLTSLTLYLSNSQVTSLAGLEQLKGLTSLTLSLSTSKVTSLAGLEQLKGLTSLKLELINSPVRSLAGLEQLKGLTSLTLDLRNSQVTSLAGLEQLKGLTSLTLNLGSSQVTNVAGLEQLKGLASLMLNLSPGQATSLDGLEQLKGLTSLTLDLSNSQVTSMAGLEQLKGLTSLTLNLSNSQVTSLTGLEQLKGLTSLKLDLTYSPVTSLAALQQLKGLTSLTLNLSNSQVTSLTGLEQLKGLTSLKLDLTYSPVTSLAALEDLKGLTSLEITLPASLLSNFSSSKIRREITELRIVMDANTPLVVPGGCKIVGLTAA